ncbi:bucentaur or craniofacial development domain-containing protein [Cardiosporidium cionae]|uniref:Bucentaur or craniofacial development domain-containing protein n=1 Tax=Cardiosporidium cionae TaxID=476202 RepID=A0ABQ7JA93_9APIC|nr:bucentaur or craniofacial development domain-containing protein [Cardiosporidium cionae]|eukprot:KAF8820928.1 bucentaur or craniofacial development domain-containing protein [Cardiosporidium cionae]
MATLFDMKLDSEGDDDDEEYLQEEVSSVERYEAGGNTDNTPSSSCKDRINQNTANLPSRKSNFAQRARKRTGKMSYAKGNEKHRTQIAKKSIDKIFDEMQAESKVAARHVPTVAPDDFMLQFQRKYPKSGRKQNSSLPELKHYLSIAVSAVTENSSRNYAIKDFKMKCRGKPAEETMKMVKNALQTDENSQAVIAKKYLFAGKVYTIEKKVDRNSRQFQKYTREKNLEEASAGKLGCLDNYLAQLKAPSTISSVEKSAADWQQFREAVGIENELRESHGFLEKQSFLSRVDWMQHHQELDRRKYGNDKA